MLKCARYQLAGDSKYEHVWCRCTDCGKEKHIQEFLAVVCKQYLLGERLSHLWKLLRLPVPSMCYATMQETTRAGGRSQQGTRRDMVLLRVSLSEMQWQWQWQRLLSSAPSKRQKPISRMVVTGVEGQRCGYRELAKCAQRRCFNRAHR